jgi:hypothetical protein
VEVKYQLQTLVAEQKTMEYAGTAIAVYEFVSLLKAGNTSQPKPDKKDEA